jgi:CheY-like chemotaxis protein
LTLAHGVSAIRRRPISRARPGPRLSVLAYPAVALASETRHNQAKANEAVRRYRESREDSMEVTAAGTRWRRPDLMRPERALKGVQMRHARVFLVEDEALIRLMLAEMIEELGHQIVAEAGSIESAQPLAETAAFDIAILDVNIGGYYIDKVAQTIVRRGLPFIFVTGYAKAAMPPAFLDKNHVCQKCCDGK